MKTARFGFIINKKCQSKIQIRHLDAYLEYFSVFFTIKMMQSLFVLTSFGVLIMKKLKNVLLTIT